MKMPKEGSQRDRVLKVLTLTPISTIEVAELTGLTLAQAGFCLTQMKAKGLVKSQKKKGYGSSWITAVTPSKNLPAPIEPDLIKSEQVTLLPSNTAAMQTSDAISTLMQTGHQNIAYRQTLQQILVIYEQLGNVLAMAGLLED